MPPKRIAILGSTGVIGRLSLEICAGWPDLFQVVGLAAGRNTELLKDQIRKFRPRLGSVIDPDAAAKLNGSFNGTEILAGEEGLVEVAMMSEADLVISSVVGFAGLAPTLAALESDKTVALANKESLVAGGDLVMEAARRSRGEIIPVDSEISAIFQSLVGHRREDLKRILLTASGGPFRTLTAEQLAGVTPEMALAHPNWDMGAKITIDSATLMNKGLEAIEAARLFDLDPDQVAIHVHPTSIVHSAVEYIDGSVIAQLAVPDMRLPIAYALSYPERLVLTDPAPLNLFDEKPLAFHPPDPALFPCLRLAREAARAGRSTPVVLNAADEIAVQAFLDKRIGFPDIPRVIEATLTAHTPLDLTDLETIFSVDGWARAKSAELI